MAVIYKSILKKDHNIATSTPITSGGTTEISSDTTNAKILTELDIANVDDVSDVVAEVAILKGGVVYYILKNATIPFGSTLKVVNNQKMVLDVGSSLHVRVNSTSLHVDIIGSYLDDVN